MYITADINLLGVYIDDFVAPDRGASAAEQFMGEGADVIFGAGGPTGSGGIKRAAEEGIYVIGVDQDEYLTTFGAGSTPGAQFLISSAVKRVDLGVYDQIFGFLAGTDAGGSLYILDAANGGITFAPLGRNRCRRESVYPGRGQRRHHLRAAARLGRAAGCIRPA